MARQIPYSTKRDRTIDDKDRCLLCGRVLTAEPAGWVTMIDGGLLAEAGDEIDENDSGYMGCYPIGPECRRKVAGCVIRRTIGRQGAGDLGRSSHSRAAPTHLSPALNEPGRAKGPREMTGSAEKTTPMEQSLMIAMTCNQYTDGSEDSWGGWTWAVIDESDIDPKQARGVLSSLIQKGLVAEETFDRKPDEYSLHFTEAGKAAVKVLLEAIAAEQAYEDASINDARASAEPW